MTRGIHSAATKGDLKDFIQSLIGFTRERMATRPYVDDYNIKLIEDAPAISYAFVYHEKQKRLKEKIREHIHGVLDIRNRHGLTPMHSAAYYGHVEVVRFLLEQGADINTQAMRRDIFSGRWSIRSSTALHFACLQGHAHIVKLLLKWGAAVHLRDDAGWLPHEIAEKHGHLECYKLIKRYRKKNRKVTVKKQKYAVEMQALLEQSLAVQLELGRDGIQSEDENTILLGNAKLKPMFFEMFVKVVKKPENRLVSFIRRLSGSTPKPGHELASFLSHG